MKYNTGFASIILVAAIVLALGVAWYGITNRSELLSKHKQDGAVPAGDSTKTDPNVTELATSSGQEKWLSYSNPENLFQIDYLPTYEASTTALFDNKTLIAFRYDDPTKEHATRYDEISIRRIPAASSRDAKDATMRDTIFDGSGMNPESFDKYQERKIGDHTFYYIQIGRFEGVLHLRYYLLSEKYGIYSFDSVAQGVDWTNPDLDVEKDSVHMALKSMLETFEFIPASRQ